LIAYFLDGKMKKKKKLLDNQKETDRAIKAAVNQAKKVEDEMERYREADRLEEALRMGRTNGVE
jgi:hypothetical protein